MVLNPTLTELPSALSRAISCDVEKLGGYIGLPPQRVSEVISAADGDRERQIHYLLLAWVEVRRRRTTVEALLKALYEADELTTAIEEVAKRMSSSGQRRYTYTVSYGGCGVGLGCFCSWLGAHWGAHPRTYLCHEFCE